MVSTWVVVATMFSLVAPLYLALGTILWRMGILRRWRVNVEANTDDIDSNEGRIRDIREQVHELDRRLELLERDHQMLHDLLTDENWCGSEHCRFCDKEDEHDD